MARHEAELIKVGELKKLQEQDFHKQIKMQEEIVTAEKEARKFHQM